MYINYSYFLVDSSSAAHIGLRQINDLTDLKGCRFGSSSYRAEIALYNATNSYTCRLSASMIKN